MKNTDTLLETARTLIGSSRLTEGVDEISAIVSTLKVGDKTNFGVVVEIGKDSITFKAKDLPKTKIAFNGRKMASRDYILDKLMKLKEETSIEEATSSDIKIVLDAAKKIGGEITGNTIDFGMGAVIKVSVEGGKIKFDGGKSSGVEHFNNVNDAVMAFESADNKYTAEVELEEGYTIKTPVVRIMMDKFESLDPNELEDFLKAAADYFAEYADEFSDFDDLATLFAKAAKSWTNRQ